MCAHPESVPPRVCSLRLPSPERVTGLWPAEIPRSSEPEGYPQGRAQTSPDAPRKQWRMASCCVSLGPTVTPTEGPAMPRWPATIARPPPRGVGSWHIYACAKLYRYARATSRNTRETLRGREHAARTWTRPRSLGTSPRQRSHLESLILREKRALTYHARRAILRDGCWCFDPSPCRNPCKCATLSHP